MSIKIQNGTDRKPENLTQGNAKRRSTNLLWWLLPCMILVVVLILIVIFVKPFDHAEGETPGEIIEITEEEQNLNLIIENTRSELEQMGFTNAAAELTEQTTTTVDGDSYYRLRQNYCGYPVYGRSAVYVTDEDGNQLSLVENLKDIPEGINLVPSVTQEQAEKGILNYFSNEFPELEMIECPEFALDSETLCIYDMDDTPCLVYEVFILDRFLLINAQSGDVVHEMPGIFFSDNTLAKFYSSGETINAGYKDGVYVLHDRDTQTYVYSANKKTYYNPKGNIFQMYDPDNLVLITSKDNIFGNMDEESVTADSINTAEKVLNCVNDIRKYFDAKKKGVIDKLTVIYDDTFGSINGRGAYALTGSIDTYLGGNYYDVPWWKSKDWAKLIVVGTVLSSNPTDFSDAIAHEYTHHISNTLVGWIFGKGETAQLAEAYSDIFGELYEGYSHGRDPDWLMIVFKENGVITKVGRNIANPKDTKTYPVHDGVAYPTHIGDDYDKTISHYGSTIISHIAYKLSVGNPEDPSSAISLEDQANLWFRSLLQMPANAGFIDCRKCVTNAAVQIGLSDPQKLWINQAFDEAGIPGTVKYVNNDCEIIVWGKDNMPYDNYEVKLYKFEKNVFQNEKVFNANDRLLITKAGRYLGVVKNLDDEKQVKTFAVEIAPPIWNSETEEFIINTDFVKPEESTEPSTTDGTNKDASSFHEYIGELDTGGDIPIRTVRWDRYIVPGEAENYYVDYLELQGESSAYKKINDVLRNYAEEFISEYSEEDELSENPAENTHTYYSWAGIERHAGMFVEVNQGGILIVRAWSYYYSGGNNSGNDRGRVFYFDVNTGEELTLSEVFGMTESAFNEKIEEIILEYVQNDSSATSFKLYEQINYFFDNGELWVSGYYQGHYPDLEYPMDGSYYFGTGLFLPQLSRTDKGTP